MYLFLVSICSSSILYAQGPVFKVNHDRGTLIVKVCSVTIEGYEGKQIIFTSEKKILMLTLVRRAFMQLMDLALSTIQDLESAFQR